MVHDSQRQLINPVGSRPFGIAEPDLPYPEFLDASSEGEMGPIDVQLPRPLQDIDPGLQCGTLGGPFDHCVGAVREPPLHPFRTGTFEEGLVVSVF